MFIPENLPVMFGQNLVNNSCDIVGVVDIVVIVVVDVVNVVVKARMQTSNKQVCK